MNLAYAERRRRLPTRRSPAVLKSPRNMTALDDCQESGLSLCVSFVGDTPYPNPTLYCDSGARYDWTFLPPGVHVVLIVKASTALLDAMPAILDRADTVRLGYPILLDIEREEVACIVDGRPVDLWQVRRGTELWQRYFASSTQ